MDSHEYITCSVVASGTLTLTFTPGETLAAGTNYRCTYTTMFARNEIEGFQWPTSQYRSAIQLVARDGAGDQETSVRFIEIHPTDFDTLDIRSYVFEEATENVIDITLQTPANIPTNARLVIEIPTLYNTTTLFDDDVGRSLNTGDDGLCEKISSTTAGLTFSCFF